MAIKLFSPVNLSYINLIIRPPNELEGWKENLFLSKKTTMCSINDDCQLIE